MNRFKGINDGGPELTMEKSPPQRSMGISRRLDGRASKARTSILVYAFLFSMTVPPEFAIYVSSIYLPIYRIILLFAFIPCFAAVLRGQNGRLNAIDTSILLYAAWSILALLKAHGLAAWQFSGITFLETMTPYLLARVYVRSSDDFDRILKVYFLMIMVLLPFAVLETFTGQHLLRDFFRSLLGHGPLVGSERRLGLDRAYVSFEHPIHYGIFSVSILGILICLQRSLFKIAFYYSTVFLAVFCSLSSGPLVALVVQTGLKIWDRITTGIAARWKMLIGTVISMYIAVDIISNRTPFHVFATYLTLRTESAYDRIRIFEFGVESIKKYPIFGIGLNEWERLSWMSSSMDNFWLVIAVRYGMPALIFLCVAFYILFRRLSRVELDDNLKRYRTGWVISVVAMMIAAATVHYWNSLYCLFMFMVGASTWLLQTRSPLGEVKDLISSHRALREGEQRRRGPVL